MNTANSGRGPLLLIMGGQDHTVPEVITKATLKQYRHSDAVTELGEFADRGCAQIVRIWATYCPRPVAAYGLCSGQT